MPALTMRGRYLMREYWSDSTLFRRLDSRERETYVGIWMLADDDGWLPRDIPGIAAAIYRYEDPAIRESWLKAAIDRLSALGKIEKHRCCLRAPAVATYPRAGTKSYEHRDEHRKHARVNRSQRESTKVEGELTTALTRVEGELTPSPVVTLPDPTSRARETGQRPKNGRLTHASAPLSEFQKRVERP